MVFIEASDRPKTLKVTVLQLIVFFLSCFNNSSLLKLLSKFLASQIATH